jgi:hypothetical protein
MFVIVCGFFFGWKRLCAGFIMLNYICIVVEDPIIKKGAVNLLTCLATPHLCACRKPRLGISNAIHIAYIQLLEMGGGSSFC